MVARYITIELKRENIKKANIYFNTSFVVSSSFAIICFPIFLYLFFNIERILHVPSHLQNTVAILFLMTGLNFLINTIKTPFSTSTVYANRFDLSNGISIAELIIRVGSMVVLFYIFGPSLAQIGISYIITAFVSFILVMILSNRLMPKIKLNLKYFRIETFKELTKSGIWNSINQLGTILLTQIDLLLSNILLGATQAGHYAIALQFPNVIRSLNSTITFVFLPTMIHFYAKDDINGLMKYSKQSVSIVGIVMALPIGLLIGFGDKLLGLWLGSEFSSLYLLVILLSVQMIVGLPMTVLGNIFIVTNTLRVPAIITCIFGLVNLLLAYILGKTSLGIYGIAIAGGIILILKNFFFIPMYAAYQLGYKWWHFYKTIIKAIITSIVVIVCSLVLKYTLYWDSWFGIILCIGISLTITSTFIITCILSFEEKKQFQEIFKRLRTIK